MSHLWVKLAIVVGLAVVLVVSVPLASSAAPSPVHSAHVSVTPAEAGSISAFSTGMAASLVLGQPSLLGTPWTTPNQTAFVPDPESSAMSPNGTLWVVDYPANRVMEFLPPYSTAEAASVVIGQSSFTGVLSGTSSVNLSGAAAVAVDAHSDLWVADAENNRVLEFVPPFRTGMAASLVLGQSNFEGDLEGSSAVNVSNPIGLSFDANGDLWLADAGNNRVIEYMPPFSTGMAASVVIGQQSMTGNQGGLSETNLSSPYDVEMSDNILWVADSGNNRILGFGGPIGTGFDATYLLGQSSFTTNTATGAPSLNYPLTVSSDSFGNLWVSDALDNRVVEFSPPFDEFENPTAVIGQSTLSGITPGDTATTLQYPFGALVSPSGDLWVTDADNDRILEYLPTVYPVHVSAVGLPPGTPWAVDLNGVAQSGTGTLTFAESNGSFPLVVTPVAGYRANPGVDQVFVNGTAADLTIAFSATAPNPFSVGMAATIVLGQPNFTSNFYAQTATASDLSGNVYVGAFDASGDLWVAEGNFNRVVEYKPPFSDDMSASLVLGQANFEGDFPAAGPTNLSYPDGLAFNPAGDLFVSNFESNQIVEFDPPFTSGMAATAVIGQSTFAGAMAGDNATNLSGPAAIAYYNGALWVTDYFNNRILEFAGPIATGEAATLVLGQSSFPGNQSGTTAVNLSEPDSVAFDAAGDLWTSDYDNSRVLRFDAPLSTGEAAAAVIGEPNMTVTACAYPSCLFGPNSVWIDGHGNLWVADTFDNRVLEYPGPAPSIPTNESASEVIGQGNLTTWGANVTATGLDYPEDAFMDAQGNLWVVDAGNNRVLGYVPSDFDLNFSETGLPASTSWRVTVGGNSASGPSASLGVVEQNGTFEWTASPVSGYVATPASGNVSVNGANSQVSVTYAPFTYAVTFTETGLASGTSWSVTIGGATHASTSSMIAVQASNGTYLYSVAPVFGYTVATSSGNVLVSSHPAGVTVAFSATSKASGLPWVDILVGVVVVMAVAGIATALLMRRRKGGSTPPGAGASPAGSTAPPPGAMGPPPPPAG